MATITAEAEMSLDDKQARWLIILFGFCMFSTGASGLVNEYVLATTSTYILGNSIDQFSLIIGFMVLCMGIAGTYQAKMSDSRLIEKFVGIEMLMAVIGGFAPLAIYAAFGYIPDHFSPVLYGFVFAIGFLIGFEIPIVMRIIEKSGVALKYNLTTVFALDYIGSFVGAMMWVYWLRTNFPLTEISFIVAGANFLVALATILYFVRKKVIQSSKTLFASLGVVTVLLMYGYSENREWSIEMEQKFYDDPIHNITNTGKQHLVSTLSKNGDFRLYINGNTQFSSVDEERYHDLLVHPVMTLHPYPQNVLILGGGDGLALREVLKYDTVVHVSLVDLDPGMVALASTDEQFRKLNRDAFADARVLTRSAESVAAIGRQGVYIETGRVLSATEYETEWVASVDVIHVDADKFVSDLGQRVWDIVIIDFPDPSGIEVTKLYSREFYKKLQWHLDSNSLIAIQATSPFHAKDAYLSIGRTMESAGFQTIPYRQNVPSFGDWGFYLAWKGEQSLDSMNYSLREIDSFKVDTSFITPEVLVASLAFGKGELESDVYCVNRLMEPCLLDQYAKYTDW